MSATPYATGCSQVCNEGRDCTCTTQHCQSTPPEAGNIYFPDDDIFGPPFTRREKAFLTLLILVYVAIWAWIVTYFGDYAIEHFFTTH